MEPTASDDPARLERDWIWRMLSTEVYWHRWRTRPMVDQQIDGAWRVVGVYQGGRQIGFARAVSDGVNDAYLADVVVDPTARGRGVGKLLIRTMIDDGPGSGLRWTLFTADAHGLYAQFGFGDPGPTAMVRPARPCGAPTSTASTTAPSDPRAMAADAVDHENALHATAWRLSGRLPGGSQSGAWRLDRPDGARAVLKTAATRDWAAQVSRASAGVARARAHGYPTPVWLAVGVTDAGVGYQIQERVPGRTVDRVGTVEARAMSDVLESQAGVDPDPDRCWNDFLADDLATGLVDLRTSARTAGPAGERLVAACDRLLRDQVDWSTVPRNDLVHGDFRPANLLFDDDRVSGVIDIEAIGSGTRVFDYATLLDHPAVDPEALELIIAAAVEPAGSAVLRTCFARVALDLVRFIRNSATMITESDLAARIDQLTDRARLIDDLAGL